MSKSQFSKPDNLNLSEDPFTTVEEAAEFYASAYRKFIFLRGTIDPSPFELLNPSAFKLKRPRKSLGEDFEALTAELFAQSIANRVNSLCSMLVGLKTWQSILPQYTSNERFYLEVEFVSPILQLAIAEIAGVKNQVAFSVAKLAIQIESNKCIRSIPRDEEISIETWETWASEWTGLEEFRAALRAVNSRDFYAATRNFRNRRAHAIAPSFFGIIPAHVITRDPVGLKIEFNFEKKLEIATLLSALSQQHVLVVRLIKAMREFLRTRLDRGTLLEQMEPK